MRQAEEVGSRQRWIVAVLASAGLAALAAGGVLAFRSVGAPAAGMAASAKAQPGCCADPAVLDQQPPSFFGLPEYPTGFEYHSLVAGTKYGSASYSARKGGAAEIARFYRTELAGKGWTYLRQEKAVERPGEPGSASAHLVKGVKQYWSQAATDQRLVVTVFDFPQKSSTAQVALSWKPLSEVK